MKFFNLIETFAKNNIECLKSNDNSLMNQVKLSLMRGDGHAEHLPPILLNDINPEPIGNFLYGSTVTTDASNNYQFGQFELPSNYGVVGVAMVNVAPGFSRPASILYADNTLFLQVCNCPFAQMEDELFYRAPTKLETNWISIESVPTLRAKIGAELHSENRLTDAVFDGNYHLIRGSMPFLHLRHTQSAIEEHLLRMELSRHDAQTVIEMPYEITDFKTIFESGPGHSSNIGDEDQLDALEPFLTRLAMQLLGIDSSADEVTDFIQEERVALERMRDAGSSVVVESEQLASYLCPTFAKTIEIKSFDDYATLHMSLFAEPAETRPRIAADVRAELVTLAKRIDGTVIVLRHGADLSDIVCEKIANQTVVPLNFDRAARYALVAGVRFVLLDTEATDDIVFRCTSGPPIKLAPKKDVHELLIDVNRRVLRLEQKVDAVMVKLEALVSKKRKAENSPSLS